MPLEIPGKSIDMPYKFGKYKCPNPKCRKDFNAPKVRTVEGVSTKHCPWCNYEIKFSKDELEKPMTQEKQIKTLDNAKSLKEKLGKEKGNKK